MKKREKKIQMIMGKKRKTESKHHHDGESWNEIIEMEWKK